MTRTLDGTREHALMLCACSRLPPWLNLATIRDIPPEPPDVLVVDYADTIHAEIADLSAREVAVSTAEPTSPLPTSGAAAVTAIALTTRLLAPWFSFFSHLVRSFPEHRSF